MPAFNKPSSKNAAATLITLALILGALFCVAALGRAVGRYPRTSPTIAQWSRFVGDSPLFYLVQISTAIVLMLAANTSFNGFPRLAAVMAEDSWPRIAFPCGSRLAYRTASSRSAPWRSCSWSPLGVAPTP